MRTRKQHIKNIIENMHAIKHKLVASGMVKHHALRRHEVSMTPSQWIVLGIVIEKTRGIKDIADMLGVTSSAATQLVDGLVRKGLVIRAGVTGDRRALAVRIVKKHEKEMRAMMKMGMERFEAMFDVLNDRELAHYAALNKKIADSIFYH